MTSEGYRNVSVTLMPPNTEGYENTSVTLLSYDIDDKFPVAPIILRAQKYSLAVIIFGGFACNLLSLSVFLTSKFRHSTAGYYLMALSVADSCVLVGEALIWFTKHLDLEVTGQSTFTCSLTYFLRYSGRLWSALLTTIITAERWLFIAHPLKSARFLTRFGARIVVVVVPVVSFALTSYALYLLEVNSDRICTISDARYTEFIIWDLVVSRLLCDVVTGCIVVVFTTLIVRTLVVARQRRHQMLPDIVETCRHATDARETQLTLTLVLVAVSFVLLKLPYTISWYVNRYLKDRYSKDRSTGYDFTPIQNFTAVAYIFAVSCYATNLFLYNLGGSLFRAKLQRHVRSVTISLLRTRRPTRSSQSTSAGRKTSTKATVV